MAWTTPLTAVANATFTAAQFNASVRDNLLATSPALATTAGRFFATTGANAIAERIPSRNEQNGTSDTTGSTSYTSTLSPNSGPAVTATSGTVALVSIGVNLQNNTTGVTTFMSYAIAGATTVASSDAWAVGFNAITASASHSAGRTRLETALTAGSNTYTTQYRVGSNTGTFSNRHLAVIPF